MSLILHLQRFSVVSRPFTNLTLHINIRQEIHLNYIHPLPTASFAASPFDVKGKLPGFVASRFGFNGLSKYLPNGIKYACISCGVRTGGSTNGRLVNYDRFIDRIESLNFLQLFRKRNLARQVMLQSGIK